MISVYMIVTASSQDDTAPSSYSINKRVQALYTSFAEPKLHKCYEAGAGLIFGPPGSAPTWYYWVIHYFLFQYYDPCKSRYIQDDTARKQIFGSVWTQARIGSVPQEFKTKIRIRPLRKRRIWPDKNDP